MLLFIDRLPFYSWSSSGSSADGSLWAACVPILLTDPGVPPPPSHTRPQRWAIDTRFSGEAYAWRQHLLEAGLNPDDHRGRTTRLTALAGTPQMFPLRNTDLWLVSNIPALQATPWRLDLEHGVAVRDAAHLPDPDSNSPLLGMRALLQSGLRIYLDCVHATVSVWVPAPWHRRLLVTARRFLTGFRTLPVRW